MDKILPLLKKISINYKYVVVGILVILVFTVLTATLEGRATANSTENQSNGQYNTNPSLAPGNQNIFAESNRLNQPNVTNLDPESSDYQDLAQTLNNNSNNFASSPASNNVQNPTSGRVLQATTGRTTNPAVDTSTNHLGATIAALFGMLSGASGGTTNTALITNRTTGEMAQVELPNYEQGAIDTVFGMTGELYANKPASVEYWATDLQERAGFTALAQSDSPTYQPGSGFQLLSPIRNLWRATSNIVYIFYVVVIIVIAFLIVFRAQLGGQNAINLFNAIPSVIISLVLVYFSYPLSALFIDLVTVGSNVTYGVLVGPAPADQAACAEPGAPGKFLHSACNNIIIDFGPDINRRLEGFGRETVNAERQLQIDDQYLSVWFVYGTAGINLSTQGANSLVPRDFPLAGLLQTFIGSFTDDSVPIGRLLLGLILAFAAFGALAKLFFSLLQEYLILMFYPVVAPFFFFFAAVPGQTGKAISGYFLRLLAASLSFIAVYALFLITIIVSRNPAQVGDLIWVPPLLGYGVEQFNTSEPILRQNIIQPLIGYSLLITAPLVPNLIKEALNQAGESAIGQNVVSTTKQGAQAVFGLLGGGDAAVRNQLKVAPKTR